MTKHATQNAHDRNHVIDYLIPVIHLMVRKKISHRDSFKEIAANVRVEVQTVHDRCVRGIGLKRVRQFVDLVKHNEIKDHLIAINKFPCKIALIDKELEY